jgi:hypothetical protein
MRDRNWLATLAFSTRWQDPAVFTAGKLSADEELISLLDLKTALLWCRER